MRKSLLLLMLMPILASCATQAQLVDMERAIAKLNLKQEELVKKIDDISAADLKGAQKVVNASGKSDKQLVLNVMSKIDHLDVEMRNNTGLWEETNNQISELGLRLDSMGSDISEVTGRLSTVEAGILSMEKSGQFASQPEVTSPRPEIAMGPVRSNSESRKRVSIPGRLPHSDMTSIEAYNLAYRDFMRGNYILSIQGFEKFNQTFPDSSLSHQAQYWIGDAYYERKEFLKSIAAFEKLIAIYPDSDKIPSAMLKESYALLEMGDMVKSEEYLKQIIERYPFAKESKLAKEKLSELR